MRQPPLGERSSNSNHLPSRHVLHDGGLASQRGLLASVGVPIVLGEEEGKEVRSGLEVLPAELSVQHIHWRQSWARESRSVVHTFAQGDRR